MRIVSLLPSATEIVCALGLRDELVGVTHECDWPPEVVGLPVMTRDALDLHGASSREIHRRVGDAVHGGSAIYHLDEDALEAAGADLILTQELCTVCAVGYREVNEAVRALDMDTTVVSLEPTSVEGILNTIATVGAMTDAEDAGVELVESLRERLRAVQTRVQDRRDQGFSGPRVAGLEWLDPPFAVGHWVPDQIRRAGGWDLLGHDGEPARETTWDAVGEVDPDLLLLMPCGYHLGETVAEWAATPRPDWLDQIPAIRRGNLIALDGSSYFSRPGPRVVDGIEILAGIFDPETFRGASPATGWTPVV
ncbi:MAG TPA: cobalamin-binding protein [Candidatus Limnocylindrales bacterium]|nr:cobalamin-binding protein [Candidatus Limnocylindrales bacterium]